MCTIGEKKSPFVVAFVEPRSTPTLPAVPSQSCVLDGSVRPQMCQEIEPLKELSPVTAIVALSCTVTSALAGAAGIDEAGGRSEEHTSELQSHVNLVCRLLLEKK